MLFLFFSVIILNTDMRDNDEATVPPTGPARAFLAKALGSKQNRCSLTALFSETLWFYSAPSKTHSDYEGILDGQRKHACVGKGYLPHFLGTSPTGWTEPGHERVVRWRGSHLASWKPLSEQGTTFKVLPALDVTWSYLGHDYRRTILVEKKMKIVSEFV